MVCGCMKVIELNTVNKMLTRGFKVTMFVLEIFGHFHVAM